MNPALVVIDASALIDALTSDDDVGDRFRAIMSRPRLAAPEHLLLETFSGIRGRLLGGKLDTDEAGQALHDLEHIRVELVPSPLLLGRMWELRDNLTGYDAAYVAAAEHLDVPLVTGDRKLAGATGPRCEFLVP